MRSLFGRLLSYQDRARISLLWLCVFVAFPSTAAAKAYDPPRSKQSKPHMDELSRLDQQIADLSDTSSLAEMQPLAASARAITEATVGPDHRLALHAMTNLAVAFWQRGHFSQGEQLLLRVLEEDGHLLGRDDVDTLVAVQDLAVIYRAQGRFSEAEPLSLRVLVARERTLGRHNEQTLTSVQGLAVLYYLQDRFDEAAPLFLRALEGYQRLPDGQNSSLTLDALGNLATVYLQQERFDEAEPLFRRALELAEFTSGRGHSTTAIILNNLAGLYLRQGRLAEAQPLAVRAVQITDRALGRDSSASYEWVLAEVYLAQNRLADAERLYQHVLEVTQRTLGPNHPSTISAAAGLAKARVRSPSPNADALAPARVAVAGLRWRRTNRVGDFQMGVGVDRAGLITYFGTLADAAWVAAQRQPNLRPVLTAEAFLALQDVTAGSADRAVVRMAVRHAADAVGSGLGALVRQRDDLEDRYSAGASQYAQLFSGTNNGRDNGRQRQVLASQAQLGSRMGEIDARLRRDFPQYFALVRPEALDVSSAQQLLAPDEAILMVVPTEFGTHVVGISHTGISWVRSQWTEQQVNHAVRRLLWDVGANVQVSRQQAAEWRRLAGTGPSFDRRTAYALYQQVVAPVAALLQGKRHVFVAVAGSLTSLPFAMLVTDAPQGRDSDPATLRATRWFADAHALVQIPSIQSLQFLRRFNGTASQTRDRGSSFIGFGDPVLQGRAEQRGAGRGARSNIPISVLMSSRTRSGSSLADITQLRRLSRLPGTAIELQSMRQALAAPAASLFLADRATEARLRGLDLSHTAILALATHGLTAGELSGGAEPGLVLTPPNRATEGDDGFLTASEVTTLRLNADWVILSACNTAAGDGSQGAPGLSGLARAFFYAGARNLLASHWPVRDDVAARLTVRTITLLRENPQLSRAEALQRAMRELREDASHDSPDDTWAHPNAWAPFSLIGEGVH